MRLGPIRWRTSGRATPISTSGGASPINGSVCCPHGRAKIAAHHEQLFQALGYVCDPDRKLTLGQADANWYALEFASLKEECRVARSQLLSIEQSLRGGRFAELQANLQQSQSQCQQLRAQIEDLRAALADGRRSFAPCRQISSLTTATGGPLSPRARHIAGEWRQNELHWRGRPRRYRGRTAFPFPPG